MGEKSGYDPTSESTGEEERWQSLPMSKDPRLTEIFENAKKRELEYKAKQVEEAAAKEQRRLEIIEQAKNEPAKLEDIKKELQGIASYERRRFLLQQLSWLDNPESKELAQQQWLAELQTLLERRAYNEALELFFDLKNDNPLVREGNFLINLHERIMTNGTPREFGFDDSEDLYNLCVSIVDKMGGNSQNTDYLKRIFYENRIPGPVMKELVDRINAGYVLDEYLEANYFSYVVKALGKINTDESVAAIERMLVDIVEKNRKEFLESDVNFYGEPDIEDGESLHFREKVDFIQERANDMRLYEPEWISDFEMLAGYFKADAITALGLAKRESSTNAIMEYIKTDQENSLLVYKTLTQTFKEINPGKAENQLLDLAKTGDTEQQRTALLLYYWMQFGARLTEYPKTAEERKDDRLFFTFAGFIGDVHDRAKGISKVYQEVFGQPINDQNQIAAALLARADKFLINAVDEVKGQGDEKKKEIIKGLTASFAREQKALENSFVQFQAAAGQLREEYKRIINDPDLYKMIFEKERFWQDIRSTDTLDPSAEQKIRENNPQRTTSEALEGLIDVRQKEIDGFPEHLEIMQSVDEVSARRYKEIFERETRAKYLKEIAELQRFLKFQRAFEQKFQALVFGREQAELGVHILENLPEKAKQMKPEALPAAEPLYFPVGISKDWPKWKEVFEGKTEAAKPLEIYGYLFWLNNQGRKAKLVVVDEIQVPNYKNLYGLSEQEAREAALRVGQKELEWYRKAVEIFGLANIEVQDYRAFQQEAGDKLEYYRKLSERFAQMQVFKPAFLAMVQDSVAEGEKEKYLPYAIEEVSWILAHNGTKVSHRNEARYDVVAGFVQNLESLARAHGKNLDSMNQEELILFAKTALRAVKEILNEKGSKAKGEEEKAYWQEANANLRLIGSELIKIPSQANAPFFRRQDTRYPFAVPKTTGQSFGWTEAGAKQVERSSFKEPYSTYFYQPGAEVFLNSDQVVAVPEGLIAGKVMALSSRVQNRYAETVIAPMLVQFFKFLEQAPAGYFEQVGKNREELLAECQDAGTLHELLQFTQKYIVRPAAVGIAERALATLAA